MAKHHLLNVTLTGLPELELFPTDSDREEALQKIGESAGNPGTWSFWFAILVLVSSVFLVGAIARWFLAQVVWPRLLEDLLYFASFGLAFFLVIRRLHRSGARQELRLQLLAKGVPVCFHCGYALQGLPLAPGRCPECGKPFSDRVREILMQIPSS